MTLDHAALYEAFDTDARPVVEFLEWIVGHYGIRTPPKVLDVGCGPGRLLAPLSALGWEVVGLEPDPSYRARAEVTGRSVGATVHDGGFEEIAGEGEFDLILGMNSSFAHVLSTSKRAEGLRRCRHALRQDGILILDLPNMLRILHEYQEPKDREVELTGRRITLSRRHTVDYGAATLTTYETYVVQEADGRNWTAEKDHIYSIVALPDLVYLLEQAGLGRIELYDSISDRQGGRIGTRMVILARAT